MSIKILEMSNRSDRGGRKKIRMALLTIHQNPTETNENGIHWDENYVRANMDSLSGMPICASFLDEDKEIPFDHGLTEIREVENGVKDAFYENSEVVGIYPEGKLIPYYEGIREFKNGAFAFAVKNQVPILPIRFTYREVTDVRRLIRKKPFITLTILEPEYPKEKICKENVIELKDRVFRKMNSKSETDLSYNETKEDSLAHEI